MASVPDYILDGEGAWTIHCGDTVIEAQVVGFDGKCFKLESEEPAVLDSLINSTKAGDILKASIPHHTGVYAIELSYHGSDQEDESASTINVELAEEIGHLDRRGSHRAKVILDAKVHEKSTTREIHALVTDVSETGVGLWFSGEQDFATLGSEFVLDAENAVLGWFTVTVKVKRTIAGTMNELFDQDALDRLPGNHNPNIQGSYVGAELVNPSKGQVLRLRQFMWNGDK